MGDYGRGYIGAAGLGEDGEVGSAIGENGAGRSPRADAFRSVDQAARLRKASEESRGELAGLQGTVGTLQSALAGHASALVQYKQQLRAVEAENHDLRQQFRKAAAAAEEVEARRDALSEDAAQREAERRRMAQRLVDAEEASRVADSEARQLRRRSDHVEAQLSAVQGRLRATEADAAELRRRLILAEAKRDAAGGRAEVAEGRLEEQEGELAEARRRSLSFEKQAEAERQAVVEREEQLRHQAAQLEVMQDLKHRLDAASGEARDFARRCEELESRLSQAEATSERLADEKAAVLGELRRAETALGETALAASSVDNLRAEVRHLQARLRQEQDHCADLNTSAREARQESAELKAALREAERRSTETTAQVRSLAEREAVLQEAASAGERAAQRAGTAEEELENLRQRCAELENSLRQSELVMGQETERRLILEHTVVGAGWARDLYAKLAPLVSIPVTDSTQADASAFEQLGGAASRKLAAADASCGKLRSLVDRFLGVLGESARKSAQAALDAESTGVDDLDDFEVLSELMQLILDKLLEDVSAAQRVIVEQNGLLRSGESGRTPEAHPPPQLKDQPVGWRSTPSRQDHRTYSPVPRW
eukprot:Hpha_TRINITY_DN17341_c0_g1::TRINITY_DN17341_c0_g1_i1::g.137890::m.137890